MASVSLYPPVVNDTEPAFVVYPNSVAIDDRGKLRINFNLSAFTSLDLQEGQEPEDILSVHVKITNSKNIKVINSADGTIQGDGGDTFDTTYRLRATNIILNLKLQKDLDLKCYYINLKPQDVSNKWTDGTNHITYENWIPGWIYKIQLRFSSVKCEGQLTPRSQEAWLFANQNNFSEWSSVIYAKAISEMKCELNGFGNQYIPTYSGEPPVYDPPEWNNGQGIFPTYITGKLSSGSVQTGCPLEYYKSYRIRLNYFENGTTTIPESGALNFVLFEDSGDIFATDQDREKIEYHLKRKLRKVNTTYNLNFSYITLNDYNGSIDYYFNYQESVDHYSSLDVYTAEYETDLILENQNNNEEKYNNHIHNQISSFSVGKDEEEGRISLKIRYLGDQDFSEYARGTEGIYYCIKRASAVDGFQQWYPIHYGYLPPVSTSNLLEYDEYINIKFDYTAESGTYYKYALEELDTSGNVLKINYPDTDERYVLRVYEHSYLLGENNQQLKITFDPSISNYGYGVEDAKITTIGGIYPYISRNTAVYYRNFPISSTIASQSDEEQIFFNKEEYYNKPDWDNPGQTFNIAEKYTEYALERGIVNRDFNLERDFRKEVIKFLYDGKPKLFKSSTEGNIIVRLTDISTTPNQSLSRLISSFSATANEIDDCNMQTCLQYGFYNPGTIQDITVRHI